MLLEIGGDQREVERSVHHPCSFLSVSSWSRSCSDGKFYLLGRDKVVPHGTFC